MVTKTPHHGTTRFTCAHRGDGGNDGATRGSDRDTINTVADISDDRHINNRHNNGNPTTHNRLRRRPLPLGRDRAQLLRLDARRTRPAGRQGRGRLPRHRLVENYDEQAALLARLEALRGEYDKRRAALAGLQAEFEAGRERLRVEREREDGERKRWFGMYRRSRLVYRGGEEEKQEEVNAQPVVNGREETRVETTAGGGTEESAMSEVATTHPTKGWDETATTTLANGHQQPEPAVADVEIRDTEPLANGHQERPAEQEQRVEIEPAATTALEKPVDNHEQPATEAADKDMPDAVEPTDKQQGLPQPAQEATTAETDSPVGGEK